MLRPSSRVSTKASNTSVESRLADPHLKHNVAADERESRAAALLAGRRGHITMHDMARVLRDMGDERAYDVTRDERPVHVCMHAGPYPARFWHATGAMISEVHPDSEVVWMTATSATDLSIFKPLFFGIPLPRIGLLPLGTDTDGTLWWRHERLHRRAMARYRAVKPEIRAEFDALEHEFHRESVAIRTASARLKTAFVDWCWHTAQFRTDRWVELLERQPYAISLNGEPTSEASIYGALAGSMDVPMILLSGDDVIVRACKDLFADAQLVQVKTALTQRAARSLSPVAACERIRHAATAAVRHAGEVRPYRVSTPCRIEFDFIHPILADLCARIPTAERAAPRTLAFECRAVLDAIGWMSVCSVMTRALA